MEWLIAIGVGAFVKTWKDCRLISLATAGAAVVWGDGKLADKDPAYAVGYIGANFALVVFVTLATHAVRRLVLYFLRFGETK